MRAPSPARPSAEGATREPGADGAAVDPLAAAQLFLSRLRLPSTILVAVSGGSDSIGLLMALRDAITATGASHRLAACTVDHALRPGSAAEAEIVSQRCRALGIPHRIARWSHSGIASGLQAQARMARYRLLSEVARAFGADLVVTGHSADDQSETVAMRAARRPAGAGTMAPSPVGLAGMADAVLFERSLWICRPFLHVRRQAVRDYLISRGEGWIEDPSNDDPRFERIRIRQAGSRLPEEGALATFTAAAAHRLQAGAAIADRLAACVRLHAWVVAEVALADVDLSEPNFGPDWQRLLAVVAATLAGKPHMMGQDIAARLFKVLGAGTPGASTAGGCVFERRGGRLFIYRERRNLPPPMTVATGQAITWDGRFTLENHGARDVTITAGTDRALPARLMECGIPPGVAGRIAQTSPGILFPDGTVPGGGAVSLTPTIAPYDTFLPRFDLMIAQSISACLRRAPFPTCPVDDISTK